VGKSTASNAFTGTGRISAQTRDLVLTAAAELGYVPNRAARQLRQGVTGTFGLYLPKTPTRSEYYMKFVFGALEQAAKLDLDIVLLTGNRLPQMDGVILADPMIGDAFADRLLTSPRPVVTCERVLAGPEPEGTVWADHGAAAARLLDHLADRGARRPGLILPRDQGDWTGQWTSAWTAWCAAHDVPGLIELTEWIPDTEQITAAVTRLHARAPDLDALVCAPVGTAAMALPGLRAHHRRVGTDLLLACGTDSTSLALTDPAITALDTAPYEAGLRCTRLLHAIVTGAAKPGTVEEIPIRLVVRASTQR
jgi:DNA-binding LacI/PurR family transcriptional regulator